MTVLMTVNCHVNKKYVSKIICSLFDESCVCSPRRSPVSGIFMIMQDETNFLL